MPLLFLVFFIAVPVVEIWVLIQVGSEIGALATIVLLFMTAIGGLALIRYQGLSTVLRATQRANVGELPTQEMGEGIFLALAGVLLLLPGFVSDLVALVLLIPWLRRRMLRRLMQRLTVVHMGGPYGPSGPHAPDGSRDGRDRHTIEGEFRRDD